jgi:threonine dehydratase
MTLTVGRIPFDILQRYRATVGGVILVDDDSLRDAMHYLYQECRLAIEPSGAATTAAVRSGQLKPSGPTVLVVSGGNVDPSLLKD